ncbi:hypothetical protein BJ912DRAFT_210690 [Pholiota molesta]|nr:hypothetical protein BJ912DRAFT_210690 [Pholiota molesta]
MLSSTTVSAIRDPHNDNSIAPPRRIRHITGIQIRNLTPYPVRDAVTTALTQPTEQSHFTASGAIDDLGAILSRRHTRKPSTNSTAARPSLKWDDGIPEDKDTKTSSLSRGRRASTSSTISSSSFNVSASSSRSTRSLRGHRPRTSSIASSSSNFLRISSTQQANLPPLLLPFFRTIHKLVWRKLSTPEWLRRLLSSVFLNI